MLWPAKHTPNNEQGQDDEVPDTITRKKIKILDILKTSARNSVDGKSKLKVKLVRNKSNLS